MQIALRVKIILWKFFHGKLPTYAYLCNLNIGLAEPRVFFGLNLETAEHVNWNCNKSRICWNLAASFVGVNLDQIADLSSGDWLFQRF